MGFHRERVAHFKGLKFFHRSVDDLILNRFMDNEPTERAAPLTVERGHARDDTIGDLVDVGVWQNDHGVVATEFELK